MLFGTKTLMAWIGLALCLPAFAGAQVGTEEDRSFVLPVQVPYYPPERQDGSHKNNAVPPNTNPLNKEELARAEALLPMLSGKQELWAMGEFVHLGSPVIPVLIKALKMPDPRLRYNAIETMGMIKHPSAAPSLVETAMEDHEMTRVRTHALRVAVRLNPSVTPEAIAVMAKDSQESVRKEAAFQSRYVREKAVLPVLIDLLQDEERFVSISAVQSFGIA